MLDECDMIKEKRGGRATTAVQLKGMRITGAVEALKRIEGSKMASVRWPNSMAPAVAQHCDLAQQNIAAAKKNIFFFNYRSDCKWLVPYAHR